MTVPVRAALVGLGGYGQRLMDAAAHVAHLQIVVGCDPNETFRANWETERNRPTTADFAQVLSDPEINAVLLATPNTTHAPLTIQAASARKHVFVEKPIAAEVADARRMLAACKDAGVTLMVGHNTRRAAGHRLLKRLVDSGELGTVVMAEANLSHAGGMALTGTEWRANRRETPGVGLMQLGVHHADTLQYLLGPVSEVTALFAHIATPADVDDATLALLRFESGPLAYLGSNYATPHRAHIALYGTLANAFCDNGNDVELQRVNGQRETLSVTPNDTVVEELTEFAACIQTSALPETNGETSLHALAIIEAAIHSAEQRKAWEVVSSQ